ncbi:MAG: hypothetical protein QOJ23_5986, partial [Actinomycetota bacterium]|nr:hypothetical protein [Actinomycetota bacterium]
MWAFRRAGSSAPAQTKAALRAGSREWASLPPLRLLVQPIASTFGTSAFEAALPSRQVPRFLQRLGHDVSPTGPAGLVSGLATPAPLRPLSQPGPLQWVVDAGPKPRTQRFDPPPWPAAFANEREQPVEAGPLVAPRPESVTSTLTHAAAPPTLPTLQLQAAPTSEPTLPGNPPSPPSADTPALVEPPPVTRSGEADSFGSTAEPAEVTGPDHGPLLSGQPPLVANDRPGAAPEPPDGSGPVVAGPPPPSHRRLGLGPPLPRPNEKSAVQRSAESPIPATASPLPSPPETP